MTRHRYRYREFNVQPDREPDAEPTTHTLTCRACGAESTPTFDPLTATAWIFTHLRQAPDHLTYRETVTRPYRAAPGAWQ